MYTVFIPRKIVLQDSTTVLSVNVLTHKPDTTLKGNKVSLVLQKQSQANERSAWSSLGRLADAGSATGGGGVETG